MPRRNGTTITKRIAETAPPGLMWDQSPPGFGLRVLAQGSRTWLLKYRTEDGRQRWHRIGTFPSMTPEEARREAHLVRSAVYLGRDPSGERVSRRAKAQAARATLTGQLAEEYAGTIPGRASHSGTGRITDTHARVEAYHVRTAVAAMGFGARPVAELQPADIFRLLDAEAARPATARARLGSLSRFLEWCREAGHIAVNPADLVPRRRRPKAPPPRARVVALADLARLWRAAGELSPVYATLARCIIVLPVRRGEAARMQWQDVNLSAGEWRMPGAITKNGDAHRIALPPLALDLLRAWHAASGRPVSGWVFPGSYSDKPFVGWTRLTQQMRDRANFTDWSCHDFRRSFASLMAERGVAESVADAVLNHRQSATRGGVLGVYQHSRRWPEQKAAMEAWGVALAEAIHAANLAAQAVPKPAQRPRKHHVRQARPGSVAPQSRARARPEASRAQRSPQAT